MPSCCLAPDGMCPSRYRTGFWGAALLREGWQGSVPQHLEQGGALCVLLYVGAMCHGRALPAARTQAEHLDRYPALPGADLAGRREQSRGCPVVMSGCRAGGGRPYGNPGSPG